MSQSGPCLAVVGAPTDGTALVGWALGRRVSGGEMPAASPSCLSSGPRASGRACETHATS